MGWPVCYGGNFAATATKIHAVPRTFWERIKDALSRDDNIEEGHYVERMWAGFLTSRLSQHDADLLLQHMDYSSACFTERSPSQPESADMFYSLRCGNGKALASCKC